MKTLITKNPIDCLKILENSGLVVIPTETVYGLAAIASDSVAVQKIYQVKRRPADNPLICHFASFEQILEHIPVVPSYARQLIQTFCPGPLTLGFPVPSNSILSPALAGSPLAMVRIPNHPLTLELLRLLNKPLAAPSSNLSGRPSHTNTQMVLRELDGKVEVVLDGGQSQVGLESTILECGRDFVRILRPGAIGKKELQEVLKANPEVSILGYQGQAKHQVPGNRYPHYSPQTPVWKIAESSFIKLLQTQPENLKLRKSLILASSDAKQKLDTCIQSKIPDFTDSKVIDLGRSVEDIAYNLYFNLQSIDQNSKFEKAFLLLQNWGSSSLALALENRISKIGRDLELNSDSD